jgi:hypothetical protein
VLIWFNVKYSGNRRRRVAAHGHPAEDGA